MILCLPGNSKYQQYAIPKNGFKHPWLDLKHLEKETFFLNDPLQWKIGVLSRDILRETGIQPEIIELRSLETCLSLACQGLGFTFSFNICETCFHNYTYPPVYLSVGNMPRTAEFVVAYRKGYQLSKPEMDFLRMLKSLFGSGQ